MEQHGERWGSLWDSGEFLPWDKLCASPALKDLLAGKEELPIFQAHTKKRALVPVASTAFPDRYRSI